MNIRNVICRPWIGVLLSLIPASLLLPHYIPQVEVLNRSISPDGAWEAVVQREDYGTDLADPLYNAVVLKPMEGWLRFLRSRKVLLIKARCSNVLQVRWNGSTELVIAADRYDITHIHPETALDSAQKPPGICLQTLGRTFSPDKRYKALLEDWRYRNTGHYYLKLVPSATSHTFRNPAIDIGLHGPRTTPPHIVWQADNDLLLKHERKDDIKRQASSYQGIRVTLDWKEN